MTRQSDVRGYTNGYGLGWLGAGGGRRAVDFEWLAIGFVCSHVATPYVQLRVCQTPGSSVSQFAQRASRIAETVARCVLQSRRTMCHVCSLVSLVELHVHVARPRPCARPEGLGHDAST